MAAVHVRTRRPGGPTCSPGRPIATGLRFTEQPTGSSRRPEPVRGGIPWQALRYASQMEWTPAQIRLFRAVGLYLSQPRFAKELDFVPRTIGNAERGTHPPSLALRRALDQALEQASDTQRNRFLAAVAALQENCAAQDSKARATLSTWRRSPSSMPASSPPTSTILSSATRRCLLLRCWPRLVSATPR